MNTQTQTDQTTKFPVLSRVRSFDFPENRDLTGSRACYMEGVLTGFTTIEGCERYVIKVDRVVFRGIPCFATLGHEIYPPLNGTPTWTSVCNGVELVEV